MANGDDKKITKTGEGKLRIKNVSAYDKAYSKSVDRTGREMSKILKKEDKKETPNVSNALKRYDKETKSHQEWYYPSMKKLPDTTIEETDAVYDKHRNEQRLKAAEPRRKGGPVKKGKKYIVGEKGPEIFKPKKDSKIIPNKKAKKTISKIKASKKKGK